MNISRTRTISMLSLIGLLPALLAVAGCSGSASTQSSQARFINAVPNGGSASFSANGAFAGNETFFNQSNYETVLTTPSTFSFTLSSNPATSFTSSSTTLANGAFYTAIAMGRADVTTSGTAGFPQILVAQDEQTAVPAGGNIRLRIFDVAPDLAAINVLVNGTAKATNITYPNLGTYFTMAAGNLTIQAVLNVGGTAQTSQVVFNNIIAGHHYTAFVVETAITPTYNIELIDDTTNTLLP